MMKWIIGFMILIFAGFVNASASGETPEVKTLDHVDLNKYIGRWYEVASIPQWFQKKCVANTVAEYSLEENGLIKVLNSCDTKTGERDIAEARAKVTDAASNSKLKVTFVKFIDWIFAFGGKYWILALGEDYSYSVVGDPTRNYAWILSRSPVLPPAQLVAAEQSLKAQGYDTCKLLTSVQAGGFSERRPLCEVVAKGP
jgi:apolipoprotein D and lipocalin family protein